MLTRRKPGRVPENSNGSQKEANLSLSAWRADLGSCCFSTSGLLMRSPVSRLAPPPLASSSAAAVATPASPAPSLGLLSCGLLPCYFGLGLAWLLCAWSQWRLAACQHSLGASLARRPLLDWIACSQMDGGHAARTEYGNAQTGYEE